MNVSVKTEMADVEDDTEDFYINIKAAASRYLTNKTSFDELCSHEMFIMKLLDVYEGHLTNLKFKVHIRKTKKATQKYQVLKALQSKSNNAKATDKLTTAHATDTTSSCDGKEDGIYDDDENFGEMDEDYKPEKRLMPKKKTPTPKSNVNVNISQLVDKVHNGLDRSLACSLCYKVLRNTEDCQQHKKSHTFQLRCSGCASRFETEKLLEEHQCGCSSFQSDQEKYKCEFCKSLFESVYELDNHITSEHEDRIVWNIICECSNRFQNRFQYIYHKKDCKEAIVHTCFICGQEMGNIKSLTKHYQKKHCWHYQHRIRCKNCEVIVFTQHEVGLHNMCCPTELDFPVDPSMEQQPLKIKQPKQIKLSRIRPNRKKQKHTNKKITSTRPGFYMKCFACCIDFDSIIKYLSHRKTCTNQITCDEQGCHKVFNQVHSFQKHKRFRHGKGLFGELRSNKDCYLKHSCRVCLKRFKYKIDLYSHRRTSHKISMGPPIKQYIFSKPSKDIIENKYVQEHVKYNRCCCEREFATAELLEIHKKSGQCLSPFHCHVCESKFLSRSGYRKHLYNKHGQRASQMAICSKSSSPKAQPSNMESGRPSIMCHYCGATYMTRKSLKRHLRNQHGEDHFEAPSDKHRCDDCGRAFSRNCSLKEHKNYCGKTYMCKYCGLVVKTNKSLVRHEQKHSLPHYCRCGERFKSKDELNDHSIVCTKSSKTCTCYCCNVNYFVKARLKEHYLQSHCSNKEGFCCSKCSFTARNYYAVQKHAQRLHSSPDSKSHVCEHCGRRYAIAEDLRIHTSIWHGDRLHSCHICSKNFCSPSSVLRHQRNVHAIKVDRKYAAMDDQSAVTMVADVVGYEPDSLYVWGDC